jgi:quercetin dioxygenase-like cupin family protein
MECDDEHAETLEKIMLSYANTPDWYNTCYRSMTYALSLRERFFDKLYEHLEMSRIRPVIDNIQSRTSLAPDLPSAAALLHRVGAAGVPPQSQVNERLNIDFSVQRVPFKTEVCETQILRIAPQKATETHKHPYESIFYVIKGEGKVRVNETEIAVKTGDVAFVPRWAMHQAQNTTDEELVIFTVSDLGLTERALASRPTV